MGSTMHPPNWGNTMARIPALRHCVLCTTSTTGRREAVVSLRWRDCAFNRRHGNAAFLCEHSVVCCIRKLVRARTNPSDRANLDATKVSSAAS